MFSCTYSVTPYIALATSCAYVVLVPENGNSYVLPVVELSV